MWPLVDEIDGVGVTGGGGSTVGITRGGEEAVSSEDVASGGRLEGGNGGSLIF